MGAGERNEQAAGAFREATAAKLWIDVVADVADIGFDVKIVLGTETDAAGGAALNPELKVVGGDVLAGLVARRGAVEVERQFSIGERAGIEKAEFRHWYQGSCDVIAE